MKTGYRLSVFIRGPYGHGDWDEIDTKGALRQG